MRARLSEKEAAKRLQRAGLDATDHRVRVLLAVGNTVHPSSAPEILEAVRRVSDINRVTVYRILDLMVEHEVLNRLGLGEKSQRFCLRGVDHAEEHVHFHCTRCDRYLCLEAQTLPLDLKALDSMDLDIDHVDIRLEGVCPACKAQG